MAKSRKQKVTLTIDPELVGWIDDQVAVHRFADKSHGFEYCVSYVKGLMLEELEKPQSLRRYAPFLEPAGMSGDSVFIKDNSMGRTVTLQVKDGNLFCLEDETKNCVHIGFAWAITEVRRILRLHGLKRPKGQE